jgi:peroxiredoxin
MTTLETRPPVVPGEPAPDFRLPAVSGDGTISLGDYRGRSPLFLALFIGLWCPFCRRSIAHLGAMEPRIRAAGAEPLGVVATPPENARLYFRVRPTRLRLAADPEMTTHRAYGVPRPAATPEFLKNLESVRINPTGELPEPRPVAEVAELVGRFDGYALNETDQADVQRQWPQLKGQFLIDREGIVRWSNIECAAEGFDGIGKFPTEEEILAAVRALG